MSPDTQPSLIYLAMNEKILDKLKILAESAKYDVSCSSSGTVRGGRKGMLGNTVGGWGICHSFADDGRCISLLKTMLTNYCIYDCAYCINRRSNDVLRATFSVSELVPIFTTTVFCPLICVPPKVKSTYLGYYITPRALFH